MIATVCQAFSAAAKHPAFPLQPSTSLHLPQLNQVMYNARGLHRQAGHTNCGDVRPVQQTMPALDATSVTPACANGGSVQTEVVRQPEAVNVRQLSGPCEH